MKWNYCPNCGQKDTVKALNKTEYKCTACQWLAWNNPRGAAAALFIKDGQILFSKRGIEPDKGRYELPGGFVEYGEDPRNACVREIEEEMGLRVNPQALDFIAAYTCEYMSGVSSLDLVYVVTRWEGDPRPDDDVAALEWKPLEFIGSEEFLRPYTGILSVLESYLKK